MGAILFRYSAQVLRFSSVLSCDKSSPWDEKSGSPLIAKNSSLARSIPSNQGSCCLTQ